MLTHYCSHHPVTVLPTCKHELPTIEYCADAAGRFKKFDSKRKLGVACPPPATCTDSLGWTIFKRIKAPVKCEGCKMWLAMNGKKTYADMVNKEKLPEVKQEGEAAALSSSTKKVKFEKDRDDPDDEEVEKPQTDINSREMERLSASLPRRQKYYPGDRVILA